MFARAVGERRRNALYRPLYNAVAAGSTILLVAYVWRQRTPPVYEVRGPARSLMLGAQAVTASVLTRGVFAIGFRGFLGLPGLIAWLRGKADVPVEPEGQGPRTEGEEMHIAGPFRHSRHPLNALTIVLLWLNPRVSAAVLGLNVAATIYLIVGSRHEESRLLRRYGLSYERYLRSGVRFLA